MSAFKTPDILLPSLANPLALFPLILAFAFYLLPGIFGHDPWKQDETYSFDMILHILQSGDWVVMRNAGEPFMEKPPLYYWTGAVFAKLFGWVFALHDSARMASGLYLGLSLAVLYRTAQEMWGRVHGWLALLVLAACPTLLIHGHAMQTDIALFFGATLGLWGLVRLAHARASAVPVLAAALTVTFLSKGLLLPGVLGLTALLLPVVLPALRNRIYFKHLLLALLLAAPFCLVWPLALYLRSQELFIQWFWVNNVGRFLGFSVNELGAGSETGYYWRVLPAFALPVWPFAMGTLWMKRGQWRQVEIMVPLLFAVILFAVLDSAASARALYALPLLAPLALLAVPAVAAMPAWLNRLLRWLGLGLTGAIGGWIAAIWIYGYSQGHMPPWSRLSRFLPEDYRPHFYLLSFSAAMLAISLWIYWLWQSRKSRFSGLIGWSAGLIMLWSMIMTVHLPWINEAKSYRKVMRSMAQAMPADTGCIASLRFGESERAMLDYFAAKRTMQLEEKPYTSCNTLIVGDTRDAPQALPAGDWQQIWEGHRHGDRDERLRMFRRAIVPDVATAHATNHG